MLSDAELSAAEVGDVSEHETPLDKPKRRNRYRDDIPTQVAERSDKETGNSPSTASTTSTITNSWQGSLESSLAHTQRARPPPETVQPSSATARPLSSTAGAMPTTPEPETNEKAPADKKDEITIVFAGRSGAGKSTLVKKLFGFPMGSTKPSASPISIEHDKKEPIVTEGGVTINIIDMAGYKKKEKKKQLKELSNLSNGEADLVLYCLPIDLSSKFDNLNPDIMASLQDAFGKDIWNHCMVVLTFSNVAWNNIEMTHEDDEDQEIAIAEYKGLIEEYVSEFKQQLATLKVEGVDVKSVFNIDFNKKKRKKWEIVCIPAGYRPRDPILPGFKYIKADKAIDSSRSNSTSGDSSDDTADTQGARPVSRPVTIPGNHTPEIEPCTLDSEEGGVNTLPVVEASGDWPTILKAEILNRSTYETQVALLRFWYEPKRIERALKKHNIQLKAKVSHSMGGGIAGGVAGGVFGGGAGLVLGVAGGPVGMGIGLTLGIVGGVIAGTLTGGGTATAVSHGLGVVESEEEEAEKEETKEDTPQK